MANPYDHQKCSCDHSWGHHEGSGGACTFREPPAEEGGEAGPQCACPKWDGQPFELPPDPGEDDDDDDEGDEPDGSGDDDGSGESGSGETEP